MSARLPRTMECPGVSLRQWGITLVELMIVIALVATLAAIAVPFYKGYIEEARLFEAIKDIKDIETDIKLFQLEETRYPNNLSEVGRSGTKDPWGNDYRYYNIQTGSQGQARKDKSLVPLNTDFDLYSMGKDGVTKLPLTPKESHDDIVRASNGNYVGLAKDY